MLFTVTIQNNSDNDIAIGDDALLRPDLWFDAQTLGLERKSFRGVAYDRIGGELVLRPGATVTQTIRLDVGELRAALANFPGMSTRVGGNVITNPVIASAGALPGPAGASFAFDRTAVQAGLPIGTAAGKKQLDAALASESPVDRLHAADFIAACAGLARHEGAPDDLKKLAKDLTNGLVTLRSDKSPLVSGWASYQMAKIGPDDQTTAIATEMSKSDDWTSRLLSLFVDSKNQKELAAALSNDADPSVKAAALAITEPLETPATQPQTQPTSMPATVPAQ
jgi:hypothetical protein